MQLTSKDFRKLNTLGSGIGGALDTLRQQIDQLNTEIRSDEQGCKEFEDRLRQLNQQKTDRQKEIKELEKFKTDFDEVMGPFMELYNNYKFITITRYDTLCSDIKKIYDKARKGHDDGIYMLMKEFHYHPAFEKWNDKFWGIPFRPKAYKA